MLKILLQHFFVAFFKMPQRCHNRSITKGFVAILIMPQKIQLFWQIPICHKYQIATEARSL